jgi:hypothetical protein
MSGVTAANPSVQNPSLNAADLQTTPPVDNQTNPGGSTALDQQFFSGDNPILQTQINPLSVPKPAGTRSGPQISDR